MNKKYLHLLLSNLALFLIGVLIYKPYEVSVSSNVATITEIREIYSNYSKSDRELIENLSFNGVNLAYDSNTSTYYLPLDMSTSQWEEGKFTTTTDNVEIVFLEDYTQQSKLECIQKNAAFTFIVYTQEDYKEYNLVFTGLPTMTIESTNATDENGLLANFSVYNNKDKSVKHSVGYMNVRGATSLSYPKNGYSIDLVEKNIDNLSKQ